MTDTVTIVTGAKHESREVWGRQITYVIYLFLICVKLLLKQEVKAHLLLCHFLQTLETDWSPSCWKYFVVKSHRITCCSNDAARQIFLKRLNQGVRSQRIGKVIFYLLAENDLCVSAHCDCKAPDILRV